MSLSSSLDFSSLTVTRKSEARSLNPFCAFILAEFDADLTSPLDVDVGGTSFVIQNIEP